VREPESVREQGAEGNNGPKRDNMTGGRRKLHNEEHHTLYSSPSITRMIKSRRIRCAWHVTRMGQEMLIGYWWGNQKERVPLGRPSRRWEDNIRMDPREIGLGDMGWIDLVYDRDQWRALVNTIINRRVP
jgi:hypothetical protein